MDNPHLPHEIEKPTLEILQDTRADQTQRTEPMSQCNCNTNCPHCGKPLAPASHEHGSIDNFCLDEEALDLAASWALGEEVYPDMTPHFPGREGRDHEESH